MVTRDRPLDWILAEISREGHIAIMLSGGVGSEIYPVVFDDVPIEPALRQLLQRYDAFYYYNGRTLRAVWVYLLNDGSGYAPVPPDSWASTLELQGKLTDRDPEARASAIENLVERQGDAAYAALLNALEDESDEVRTRALYGAQTAGVELPTDFLSDMALNDPSEEVRFLALEALADDPELPVIAEQALEDPSPHIRSHAQQILARPSREDQPEESTE
jgi:HEAT repeat protein